MEFHYANGQKADGHFKYVLIQEGRKHPLFLLRLSEIEIYKNKKLAGTVYQWNKEKQTYEKRGN